jgi:hypothetical protein
MHRHHSRERMRRQIGTAIDRSIGARYRH